MTDSWQVGSALFNSVDQTPSREAGSFWTRRDVPNLWNCVQKSEPRVPVVACQLFTVGGIIKGKK
jgi:hypothetical protein